MGMKEYYIQPVNLSVDKLKNRLISGRIDPPESQCRPDYQRVEKEFIALPFTRGYEDLMD
jgi:hypothetical protein